SPAPPRASAAPDSQPPPRLPSFVMPAQFESFRAQLDESSTLRDRIRTVVSEIESASRVDTAALLLVHQPVPLEGCRLSSSPISLLLGGFHLLAPNLVDCSGIVYPPLY